jgi:hypothetical protein
VSVSRLDELRADRRVREALAKAVEMADACDAAAREAIHLIDDPAAIAMACGAAAQAWAAVHTAARRNGEKD